MTSEPIRIDGKAVAAQVLDECQLERTALREQGVTPGLAVVLVGDDPPSQVYVASKVRTCAELGLPSRRVALPAAAPRTWRSDVPSTWV
jgi:methylenetetrahydrofolate dehydrogenase (NADP+)/methenyltetrahydrofolate cyclohydrolase